jgi:pSer/pThr/pTyr-binding forkhead associated (FHA) protein
MPRIQITTTDGATLEFEISSTPSSFGRAEDNDFIIPDGSVSSHHGEIFADGDGIQLKDNGSTNGTFIRGGRVEGGTVNPGESFKLGSVEGLVVAVPEQVSEESSSEDAEEPAEATAPASEWSAASGGGAAISGLGATPCPSDQREGFGPKTKKREPIATAFMGVAILSLGICAVAIFMIMKMGS